MAVELSLGLGEICFITNISMMQVTELIPPILLYDWWTYCLLAVSKAYQLMQLITQL